jgi:hypothetical protein
VAREAQQDGVPLLLLSELPSGMSGSAGEGVFSLAAAPGVRGKALAKWLSDTLPGARVLVLKDALDPVAVTVAAAFVRELPRSFRVEEGALGDPAASLGEKPGAVLLACPPGDFGKHRQRLLDAGFDGPVLYGGEDAGPEELRNVSTGSAPPMPQAGPEDAGKAVRRIVLATVYCPEGLTEQGQEFARKYQEKFGVPPDLAAAQAYDGARLLLDAIRRAETTTAPHIRDELGKTKDFETVTGPLRFDDHAARRRVFVLESSDGRTKLLRTQEPEGN